MAILPILKYPDPRLRSRSLPVESFDEDLATLAGDLRETMIHAPGSGLAAPQVDKLLRVIVIDDTQLGEEYGQKVLTLVNPQIIEAKGEQIYQEGCLSVIDLQSNVIRAAEVTVEAQDVTGQKFTLSASGRQAVILQHEIDHLEGVLFLDRISRLKKDIYRKKLFKSQKMAKNS
ncbi:MAG: peptide deformylase [Deltaproteobacteria bacterium]|jgi:peptide deformylase|nr:peptide deformylase [Deltaproteobacteria bacterium]